MNIRWPKIATNNEVYETTRQKPWSQVIEKRELSWFGHLIRLADDTPAKLALRNSLRLTKKPRGRQKTTWISMMKAKFKGNGLEWEDAIDLATDRSAWNSFIRQSCQI